jgi:hypothetical protein
MPQCTTEGHSNPRFRLILFGLWEVEREGVSLAAFAKKAPPVGARIPGALASVGRFMSLKGAICGAESSADSSTASTSTPSQRIPGLPDEINGVGLTCFCSLGYSQPTRIFLHNDPARSSSASVAKPPLSGCRRRDVALGRCGFPALCAGMARSCLLGNLPRAFHFHRDFCDTRHPGSASERPLGARHARSSRLSGTQQNPPWFPTSAAARNGRLIPTRRFQPNG